MQLLAAAAHEYKASLVAQPDSSRAGFHSKQAASATSQCSIWQALQTYCQGQL
jgi:hypothetical protein